MMGNRQKEIIDKMFAGGRLQTFGSDFLPRAIHRRYMSKSELRRLRPAIRRLERQGIIVLKGSYGGGLYAEFSEGPMPQTEIGQYVIMKFLQE